MIEKPLFIRVEWDEIALVWVRRVMVPGLVTEEKTLEGLVQKLKVMIPEILEANGTTEIYEVPFEILTRRFEITQRIGC